MQRFAKDETIGLEIGPMHIPYVERTEGNNIFYTDWQSTEDLKKQNINNPELDVDDIVDIDFIWDPKKKITECTPLKFDYIVASQVVEHIPDMIGWMQQLFDVLRPGGVLTLGIPDKRYTFDAYRNSTTPAEIIETYVREEKIPTIRQIYDNCKNAIVVCGDAKVNTEMPFDNYQHLYTPEEALNFATYSYFHQKYLDIHCTVCTPDEFQEAITEIVRLGFLSCEMEVEEIADSGSFVAYLTKVKDVVRTLPPSRERQFTHELNHVHAAHNEGSILKNIFNATFKWWRS